ncbi:YopX family protein [Parendozoicomonas sp. Alg238-R29]|uniref:YopX family protein n=1 Tax=Parendozoicomonas sp. Alg238-R29 TaxID=2993446 RepID=UPI00248E3C34|nr:YopX family protein [Parendozoicomonas sp. Alg238-R29]
MREIKFRAWRKGRWPDPKMIHPYSLTMPAGGAWIGATGEHETIGVNHYDKDQEEFVLMQFTGLKDKNGVEIYEGDLLECVHDCDDGDFATIAKVQFGDYMGWEIHHISGHGWGPDSKEGLAEWADCADDYLKVVGNIYENPELAEAM